MAPGVISGSYDPAVHAFANFDAFAVHEDLLAFHGLLKALNPTARMLLTVSPVPLIATASAEHVLVATTYSKSVLRAVAGSLAERLPDCHYFPSFELISSHPSRGMFFNPESADGEQARRGLRHGAFLQGDRESRRGERRRRSRLRRGGDSRWASSGAPPENDGWSPQ